MPLKLSHIGFIHLRKPLQSIKYLNDYNMDSISDFFKSGVFIASKDLYNTLQDSTALSQRKLNKLNKSIYKYWVRSCTRPTPFGLFAGCTFVKIGETTSLTFDDDNDLNISTRLDMECLYSLISKLSQLPHINSKLKYFPNNSIYQFANSLRFAKYSLVDTVRVYDLISVENTVYLQQVLTTAKHGATKDSLKNSLKLFLKIPENEIELYIDELIEAQVLISDIEPSLTNANPLSDLIIKLESIENMGQIASILKHINNDLKNSNSSNLLDLVNRIHSTLDAEDLAVNSTKDIVQVDAIYTGEYCIDNNLVSKIVQQVSELSAFTRKIQSDYLDDFKKAFRAKYEDAFMPLSIVLDADAGIGYANVRDQDVGTSELIAHIHHNENNRSVNYRNINKFILKKYLEHIKSGKDCINITEEEIKRISSQNEEKTFSASMYILGNLFGKNKLLNENNFCFNLIAVSGPSSSNLLGRFAYCDNNLLDGIITSLKDEENTDPNAIYAEVVHFPQSRAGNILIRPLFRKYEIPYIGKSGARNENQIPISDLYVSVIDNKVTLYSKKFGKVIIPRLTTAHDSDINSLPIYRFLCDLQFQEVDFVIPWDWGELLEFGHLPRVVYKDIIVQKAIWKIKYADIEEDLKQTKAQNCIASIKTKLNLADRVVCKNGEQEFVVDFGNTMGIELLYDILCKKKVVILEEFLFNDTNYVISDKNGKAFTNEVVIPVKAEGNLFSGNTIPTSAFHKGLQRKFYPGEEWLYFKIYCGNKNAETILKTHLFSLVNKAYKEERIEKFFFIRYHDTLPHLRVRFYNPNKLSLLTFQKDFFDFIRPLIDNGTIDKITIDTYNRELERYGNGKGIELAESLFFNDSLCVLEYINYQKATTSDKSRIYFAFHGIDFLLRDFKLDLNARMRFMGIIKATFFNEFGGGSHLERVLNDKYRTFRKQIISVENKGEGQNDEYANLLEILNKRSIHNAPVIDEIYKQLDSSNLNGVYSLISSFVHMFMNRLFISQQRKYELVLYHLLEKHYSSQLAYLKNNPNIQ